MRFLAWVYVHVYLNWKLKQIPTYLWVNETDLRVGEKWPERHSYYCPQRWGFQDAVLKELSK